MKMRPIKRKFCSLWGDLVTRFALHFSRILCVTLLFPLSFNAAYAQSQALIDPPVVVTSSVEPPKVQSQTLASPLAPGTIETLSLWEVEQRAAINRSIVVLEKSAAVARAEVGRINVRPNPTLSAQYGNSQGGRYSPRESDRIWRIDQLFERGNKQALRADSARALAQAAGQEIFSAVREQKQQASQAYYDLVLAQIQEVLIQDNLIST